MPSADRTPTWPRCSHPSLRRGASPPLWRENSSRRIPAHRGHSRGPGASSLSGPVATGSMAGAAALPCVAGLGPAPALPGFAGGVLEGRPWPIGWSWAGCRKPGWVCWQAPASHCGQGLDWASGGELGSAQQLQLSCCLLQRQVAAGLAGPAGLREEQSQLPSQRLPRSCSRETPRGLCTHQQFEGALRDRCHVCVT